jgi:hypothetical protein
MSALLPMLEFVTAPVVILLGTSFFTRGMQTRHRLRLSTYWISAFAGMTYVWTLTCLLAARTRSRSIGLGINLDPLGYGRGYLYSRERDRGHDRPEHHTSDVRDESPLRRRPMVEAEGRQR